MGTGFYGAVVRQWADEGVAPWNTWLVGVEVFGAYRNPLWDLYNAVFNVTIEDYLARHSEPFDCVLFNDVLEHFDHAVGESLLRHLPNLVAPGGVLFVNTPALFHPQQAAHGNEFERHRSLWSAEELASLGFTILLDGTEPQYGGFPTLLASWNRA
jgi:SAM-dependent methyltransferase